MGNASLSICCALTMLIASGSSQSWAQTEIQHPIEPGPIKVLQPVQPVAAQLQIVNGELVLGDQKIPMTQGDAIPGLATLSQKMQAALPAYLTTKFKGPTLMVVPESKAVAPVAAKTLQPRVLPPVSTRLLPEGFAKVLKVYQGYKVNQSYTVTAPGLTTPTLPKTGPNLPRKIPFYTPLNENRLAALQTFLTANAPSPWGAAAPQHDSLDPNNFLIDPLSANAFAGPLLVSPIACPVPSPASSASVNAQATCYSSPPLYVAGPIVSIAVPTHFEIMDSATGSYDVTELPLTQISVQVLSNPSSPTTDTSDPDGLTFTNNLAAAGVTADNPSQPGAPSPAFQSQNGGQAVTLNVQNETWNPLSTNPAWMVDSGLWGKYGYTGLFAPLPMLAYPNPYAAQSAATDTVTFNLQLSQVVTVVRFNLTQSNSYIALASIVVPIVVQPAGTVEGKVQPVAIAYEPPGNMAAFQYSTSQSGGVTVQSQYQLSSTQSQQNSSSQAFALAPDASATLPTVGVKLGLSGTLGTTSGNTNQDTEITSTTTTAAITDTWTDTTPITGGWPQPPKGSPPLPAQAPAVTPWQATTEYCGSGALNLIQPTPPDGNAYLCENDGISGATMPPTFDPLGATTDGTVTWMNVGSAALFQSPFWEDTIYLEPFPMYAVWDMPGSAGSGSMQVAPMPAGGIPWGINVLQLHLCLNGLYQPVDAAANLTLSPYDCANLLTLDPFYLYGQHATLTQANTTVTGANGALAVAAQGYGIPPGQSSSTAIQKVVLASATNGTQTSSSFATGVTAVTGSNWSIALSAGIFSGNASGSSSQQSGSSITSAFQSQTSANASVTAGISGTIAVSGNQSAPASGEYVDARFGSIMFPSVDVGHLTITPQGCAGQEIFIDGAGLTGTTTVTFTAISPPAPAFTIPSFTVASDEEVDVWLPAPGNSPGYSVPPVGTYSVAIQGEGFSSTTVGQFQVIPGQFQSTSPSCAAS